MVSLPLGVLTVTRGLRRQAGPAHPPRHDLRRLTALPQRLNGSQEGIASSILANRLKRLVEPGTLTTRDDPIQREKAIYRLTELSIELVPIMVALGTWGCAWLPVSEELLIGARVLEEGGPNSGTTSGLPTRKALVAA